jgi:MFS family permease
MSLCYSLGMGAMFASVSVVSLVVAERVGPGLALLPPALQKLVATLSAFPGARHKTKTGFSAAALLGSIGYFLSFIAVGCIDDPKTSFAVLCLSYCISGVSDPFVQFLRFAASDISPKQFKSRAISYVVAGGAFAAVFGPELANLAVNLIPGRLYAGSYLMASMLLLLQACVIRTIDFSHAPSECTEVPEEATKTIGEVESAAIKALRKTSLNATREQSLWHIITQPQFMLAASTAAILQLTMITLMQITPLTMSRAGFDLWHAVRVIQGHILGMYIPSFFTGSLISRFGKLPMMISGLLLNLVAASCLLTDTSSFWSYFTCLTTIGIGWNWGFVSATASLTDATEEYSKADQAKAKGFNDFCIQLLGAIGTLATGFAAAALGWTVLVLINAALIGLQLSALLAVEARRRCRCS